MVFSGLSGRSVPNKYTELQQQQQQYIYLQEDSLYLHSLRR